MVASNQQGTVLIEQNGGALKFKPAYHTDLMFPLLFIVIPFSRTSNRTCLNSIPFKRALFPMRISNKSITSINKILNCLQSSPIHICYSVTTRVYGVTGSTQQHNMCPKLDTQGNGFGNARTPGQTHLNTGSLKRPYFQRESSKKSTKIPEQIHHQFLFVP